MLGSSAPSGVLQPLKTKLTQEITMASISVNITAPQANQDVGRNILITGSTDEHPEHTDPLGNIDIQSVKVQFGKPGSPHSAESDGLNSSWLGTAAAARGAPHSVVQSREAACDKSNTVIDLAIGG
jgi:hypothetical protein